MVEQAFIIQRPETVLSWKSYSGEGEEYVRQVFERFKKEFGDLPGIHKLSYSSHHGSWAIDISHPFIFDRRRVPVGSFYLGVSVRGGTPQSEMPEEFQADHSNGEYTWAYQRYERFVDRCADQIRQELGDPNMTREEMLDALVPGGNFEAWKSQCGAWEKEGRIPLYKD